MAAAALLRPGALRIGPVVLAALLCGQALHGAPARGDEGPGPWAVTVYGGPGTDGGIEEIPPYRARYRDAYLVAIAPSRELMPVGSHMVLGAEGQVARYYHDEAHSELNGLLFLRWLPFPWDGYVDTSAAIGDGVSWASRVPEIEKVRSPRATSKVLNYLLLEFAFAIPAEPRWSLVLRLHHRSGVLGIFDGVRRGSNTHAVGVRYRF